jgi:hypothetical protein
MSDYAHCLDCESTRVLGEHGECSTCGSDSIVRSVYRIQPPKAKIRPAGYSNSESAPGDVSGEDSKLG